MIIMLKSIEDTLGKSCLLGLSYFNIEGELLKQTLLAGKVIAVDKEMGISVQLIATKDKNSQNSNDKNKQATFIIPTDLSCWFTAPKGEFHTSDSNNKITDPDYLVTWDIYQSKDKQQDGEQQWWQWHPRTQQPSIG